MNDINVQKLDFYCFVASFIHEQKNIGLFYNPGLSTLYMRVMLKHVALVFTEVLTI